MKTEYGRLDIVDGRLICHECGRGYLHLATHIRGAHDMSAEAYREKHGLSRGRSLVAPSVSDKLSATSSDPERLEHLASVRDIDALQARAAHPGQWRAEHKARHAAANRARTAPPLPESTKEHLPPWDHAANWGDSAILVIDTGEATIPQLARLYEKSKGAVEQRILRARRKRGYRA